MRKFFIENDIGQRIALSDRSIWLNKPAGLGMRMANTYISAQAGFHVESAHDEEQSVVTGTMVFLRPDTYESFRETTDWLMRSTGLKLIYLPYGSQEFYRDIDIESIDKTEKRLHRMLECAVSMRALTPWYSQINHVFEFMLDDGENYKRYDYRYNYRYAQAFLPNSIDFEIDGHYPGEVEVIANGPIVSLVLKLTNTNTGEVYGVVDLGTISIGEGERLEYSSKTRDPGVWLVSAAGRRDVIDLVELHAGSETFFRVPPNIPVTATMTVGGQLESKATMRVTQYYRLR